MKWIFKLNAVSFVLMVFACSLVLIVPVRVFYLFQLSKNCSVSTNQSCTYNFQSTSKTFDSFYTIRDSTITEVKHINFHFIRTKERLLRFQKLEVLAADFNSF